MVWPNLSILESYWQMRSGSTLWRQYLNPRLRQKYAWLFYGGCSPQSSNYYNLWRYNSTWSQTYWYVGYSIWTPSLISIISIRLSLDEQAEGRISEHLRCFRVLRFVQFYRQQAIFTIRRQVLSLLVRSAMRNDSMLFVMPVRVLELAVECSLPTLWARLSRLVLQMLYGALFYNCVKALGMSLPYSSSNPASYPGTCQRSCLFVLSWSRCLGKVQECIRAAKYMKNLLALDLKPKCVRIS